ncbi:MAG: lipid-binding SYLF domain-containing protein [Chthoniobacterales bacterium]|nr:lipid-binding SYLF domain-containing protein [Chthoniobacterales bacterium]
MKKNLLLQCSLLAVLITALFCAAPANAMSAHRLEIKSQEALQRLCKNNAKAEELSHKAVAILVFPEIVKAGLIFGGQRGDGVLFRGGNVDGFYNTTAASYGLQVGIQKFGYALFFMNEKALAYFKSSDGFELGTAPSITIVDVGAASSLSTTTLQKDIYAFFFHQRGLMAGLSLQGTKITKFTPSK